MKKPDAVYVLSVKTFTDRIAHMQKQLAAHQIDFEFIFEHDVGALDPVLVQQTFGDNSGLSPAHQSLILKNITAWQRCLSKQYQNILILEDDAVLCAGFTEALATILDYTQKITPGYLIFLGGASGKVPACFFLEQAPIFKHSLDTAEGYLTDRLAIEKRLAWLLCHRIDMPADHLIKAIDAAVGIQQYWATKPLVEQGSLFGLFNSSLDGVRQQQSRGRILLRYRLQILRRKVLAGFWARLFFKLKSRE